MALESVIRERAVNRHPGLYSVERAEMITPAMYDAFQSAFSAQLQVRHKARYKQYHECTPQELMSAEEAGLRAMVKLLVPDFDAVRDKCMSDLTPQQQDDALELWIREHVEWYSSSNKSHVKFLLRRLDEARFVEKK
jgi:hypothetical protein